MDLRRPILLSIATIQAIKRFSVAMGSQSARVSGRGTAIEASSAQSPPSEVGPVRSVAPATSAPVTFAGHWMTR